MRKTIARTAVPAALAAWTVLIAACVGEDDEMPVPQEHAETDLIPDQTSTGAIERALTSAPDTDWTYDRGKALAYIEHFAKEPNWALAYCASWQRIDGAWTKVKADCTNFASQVLWYGGMPMQYGSSEEEGWWYRFACTAAGSSKSWRQVNRLLSYLVTETGLGEFKPRARDLEIGDVIFYRLRREDEGFQCGAGNLFNHTAIVSGFDADGEPLVSYHSNDALHVPWAAENGSPKSLGQACLKAFVHVRR